MIPDAASRQEIRLAPILATELSTLAAVYATVNPRLFSLRIWLVSIALASTWNLCTNYALTDPWMNTFNFGICVAGFTTFMKLIEITVLHKPPKYNGGVPCSEPSFLCARCLKNSISYMLDIKCMYWENDSLCPVPSDDRGDASHLQFYTHTFLLFIKHLLICDTLHTIIESIGTLGTPQGDTIFRRTFAITKNLKLSVPHPAISAVYIAFMVGVFIWHFMSTVHCLCTLFTAPLACLPPSISPYSRPAAVLKKEWPPLFDNPLAATSVRDFWSRRWHACFRRNFFITGAKPGAIVGESIGSLAGSMADTIRVGGVMGVFLMSGLLHDFGMWEWDKEWTFGVLPGTFLFRAWA
ncbi:Membrane bound O-acyl transferase family [Rhizoctonia solani]|uniref:Membrane bound O-acyl transferase family n=1 Tax=Rhizoctonia solani TaxID=456999 RepID=A0A8H7M4X1_9AGAM|nr:Membrane bound O-acyl transferase family [Rhizoctonia solani]